MEELRQWSVMLCMAALGCAALRQIVPQTGTGKLFRLLIATFFLCCLITPLLKLTSQISLDTLYLPETVVSQELEKKVNEQLITQVEQTATELVRQVIENRGFSAEKIEINTDTYENGSIYIQHIDIYVDKQSVPAALVAEEVLEQQLETEVNILTG